MHSCGNNWCWGGEGGEGGHDVWGGGEGEGGSMSRVTFRMCGLRGMEKPFIELVRMNKCVVPN